MRAAAELAPVQLTSCLKRGLLLDSYPGGGQASIGLHIRFHFDNIPDLGIVLESCVGADDYRLARYNPDAAVDGLQQALELGFLRRRSGRICG